MGLPKERMFPIDIGKIWEACRGEDILCIAATEFENISFFGGISTIWHNSLGYYFKNTYTNLCLRGKTILIRYSP